MRTRKHLTPTEETALRNLFDVGGRVERNVTVRAFGAPVSDEVWRNLAAKGMVFRDTRPLCIRLTTEGIQRCGGVLVDRA